MRLRDELGPLFRDADFVGCHGQRGRPGYSPAALMLVLLLQFTENLTDAQAAEAVAERIGWKYALGLRLEDSGFDSSVLSEFRARLVGHELSLPAFDRFLIETRADGREVMRRRTDSDGVPPGRYRLAGPYDTDVRWAAKGSMNSWLAPAPSSRTRNVRRKRDAAAAPRPAR